MHPRNEAQMARTAFSLADKNVGRPTEQIQTPTYPPPPRKKSLGYGEVQMLKHMTFLQCIPKVLDKIK